MAKYSFETTTVGEMLDTPEIMEIIQKNIPDVLEHPLLEVGRSFIFNDALPYIELDDFFAVRTYMPLEKVVHKTVQAGV